MTTIGRKYLNWVVKDYSTGTEYDCVLKDNSIHYDLKDLNHGTVYTIHNFNGDARVQILEKTASSSRILLEGYVKDQSVKYAGASNITIYQQDIMECAEELVTKRVKSGTSYTVSAKGTINAMVDTAISGTGWTRKSAVTGSSLPDGQFYYMTVMKALETVVQKQAAATYYLWFETAPTFAVCYGTYRNDRTATNITSYLSKKVSKNTVKKNVGAVVIIGKGGSTSGMYPTAYSDNDMMVYQYEAATSSTVCAAWAERVWKDLVGATAQRVTLELDPASSYVASGWIQEGDQIQVDGTNYIVMDIVYKQDKVTLGLNAYNMSVFDILGDSLVEVSGEVREAQYLPWDGQWQNVSASPGGVTEWTFNIADFGVIGPSFNLTLTASSYRTYANQNPFSHETDRLSDVTPVITSGTDDDTGSLGLGAHYIPDSTGVDCTNAGADYMNGYQFAMLTLNSYVALSANVSNSYIVPQIMIAGAAYVDVGAQVPLYFDDAGLLEAYTISVLATGTTTQEDVSHKTYVRWKIYVGSGDANAMRWYYNRGQIFRLSRHTHTGTAVPSQTNNVVDTGSNPTALQININSASWCAWALPAASSYQQTQDVKSLLTQGVNKIQVRTNSSGTGGSARVTAYYSSYGK